MDWLVGGERRDLFATITELRRYERIRIAPDGIVRERRLPVPHAKQWAMEPPEALVMRLREAYVAAVERSIGSARRVCVFVGGIDSSGLLAAVCQLLPASSVVAVTLTFDRGNFDPDIEYVEDLAKHLGVACLRVPYEHGGPPERSLIFDEYPSTPYQGCERVAMERAVDLGAEACLSAAYGDYIFGGDFRELGLRPPTRAVVATLGAEVPWFVRGRSRARWMLDARLPALAATRNRPLRWLRGAARKRWARAATPVAHDPTERLASWTTNQDIALSATYSFLSSRGLPLRCVDATADDQLQALVSTIPIETLNCDGRYRGLFHRIIDPWVTRRVAERRTKSNLGNFTIPRTPAMRDLADARELSRRGLVDGKELIATFDSAKDITPLWSTLALEAWLRRQG